MNNHSKKELTLILICFFLPLISATYFYWAINNKSISLQSRSYGYLFHPGEQIEHTSNKKWTILHLKVEGQERYPLWQQQLVKMKKMFGPLAESVDFREINAENIESLSWEYDLHQGGIIVVDYRGFLALGYRYDQEPKKTFIELI